MPQGKRTAQGAAGGLLGFVGLSAAAGILVTAAVTPALAVTGMTANNAMGVFTTLPDALSIGQPMERSNIYVTNNNGDDQLIASFYDQNRQEVGWDDVSQNLKDAAVSTEDPRFYEHGGIDVRGTTRAVINTYIVGGNVQGGSSITQQYVKNVLVQECEKSSTSQEELAECSNEATASSGMEGVGRKLQEMRYAIGVEKEYSKDEILLGYLNLANFGSLNYGVESASQYYFGKSARDVNIAESATLISILNSPSALRIDNPDGQANGQPNGEENNWEQTKNRRNYIINDMLSEGKITADEAEEARSSEIQPNITPPSTGCSTAGQAAYFCDYVQNVVKNNEAFGETPEERSAALRRGGLNIYTTLNMDLQNNAQEVMAANVPANPESIGTVGAAASTVEPGTGRVLSMVQNTTYSAGESDDPGATAINYNTDEQYGGSKGFQPGSTNKVYTLTQWLKEGKSLNERVPNPGQRTHTNWPDSCSPGGVLNQTYTVQNFDNVYPRSINALDSTKRSVNTAFLAMANQIDLCGIVNTAKDLGVHPAGGGELERYPATVLGSVDLVSPLTMAASIASFGANGTYCEPTAIDRVVGPDGEELSLPENECRQAVDEDVANTANFAMQSVFEPGGTGALANVGGAEIFGKTGTSDNARASWITGGTSKAVTSIWVGAVTGTASMYQTYFTPGSGHQTKLIMWQQMMQNAIDRLGGDPFAGPAEALMRTPQSSVPNVTGQTVQEAQATLRGAGFGWIIGSPVQSEEVPEGRIAQQNPAPGSTAPTNSSVTISPSSGRPPEPEPEPEPEETEEPDEEPQQEVPDVSGRNVDDARRSIEAAGFSVETTCREGDEGAEGIDTVVAQDPGNGADRDRGSTVSITILRANCE